MRVKYDAAAAAAFKPAVKFNIKQVADLIGVVPATIRNWERAGIFTAKRGPNQYRYFDYDDVEFLRKVASYSIDGMSVSFIKKMMENSKNFSFPTHENVIVNDTTIIDYSGKLNHLRKQRKLTLADVCNEIGISQSYLSRIEHGQCNVTLPILEKLAKFYDDDSLYIKKPAVKDSPLIHGSEGFLVPYGLDGVTAHSMTAESNPSFCINMVTIQPGGGCPTPESKRSGIEVIHILAGSLTLCLDGSAEETYDLGPNDTFTFQANRYVTWVNNSKERTKLIWYHSYV